MKKDERLFVVGNETSISNTLTLGRELLVLKSDIITIGFPENKIEILSNGDILHNGKKCEVDVALVKNLDYIFRKLLDELTRKNT